MNGRSERRAALSTLCERWRQSRCCTAGGASAAGRRSKGRGTGHLEHVSSHLAKLRVLLLSSLAV